MPSATLRPLENEDDMARRNGLNVSGEGELIQSFELVSSHRVGPVGIGVVTAVVTAIHLVSRHSCSLIACYNVCHRQPTCRCNPADRRQPKVHYPPGGLTRQHAKWTPCCPAVHCSSNHCQQAPQITHRDKSQRCQPRVSIQVCEPRISENITTLHTRNIHKYREQYTVTLGQTQTASNTVYDRTATPITRTH